MRRTRANKDINFKKNLNIYFEILNKYKVLFWGMIFVVVLTEALFIFDKFLYKKLIDDAGKFVSGFLEKNIFVESLLIIGGIFLIMVILRSAGEYLSSRLLMILEPKLVYDLKEKYFNHILNLSYKFHSENKTGSLISRLNRGGNGIETMTDIMIFQIAPLILQTFMILISIVMFTLIPAIILIVVVLIFIWYSIIIQKTQQKHKLGWNRSRDKESGFIADVFTNVESIKYFGKEKRILLKFRKLLENSKKTSRKYWGYFAYLNLGQQLILGIGTIVILYFPLIDFLNKELTLGTIVLIYTLYWNATGNLFGFVHGIRGYYKVMADFEDLFQYGEEVNEIKDLKNAKKLKIKNGEIEFKNVSFKYGNKKIFKNLNLKIKPNEKIALVGHSGSGKTTLVKLLNRFYDVDSGEILIDGKNIKNFTQQSIRSETGIVPQECILFDDTIFNNVKFSKPFANKDEIHQAMEFAQLDEVVKTLPLKERTIVGERGVKLSGGEKQRVSIARAILSNKKILVLDEATSALDSRTEYEIQKDLVELLKGRTSIIIAHRLSTIMNADRILVFKEGKIIEEGKHKELIRKKGEYSKLWDLQQSGYLKD